VARLNASGSQLVFSTYLGGSRDDRVAAIALDSAANIYIAGPTNSDDFPQVNALNSFNLAQPHSNFVAQMTSDGQALVYSTYFLSSDAPIFALSVTPAGIVYVTGYTLGSLPTVHPYQAAYGGNADAFIAILQPS